MDDWQEAAFTTRHVHNRASKSKAGGGRGRRGGAFEVKKTLGRYDVKCPSANTRNTTPCDKRGGKTVSPSLDVFRLSDDGRGLLGELILPGILEARVILTGNRKTLGDLILQAEEEGEDGKKSPEPEQEEDDIEDGDAIDGAQEKSAEQNSGGDSPGDEECDEDQDKERSRFYTFEKNSFRSPKFWFQWKGQVMMPSSAPAEQASPTGRVDTGRGYIVFSGNDCRSFKGTITCDVLGWKDVSLSGWKEVSMSERDVAFVWS